MLPNSQRKSCLRFGEKFRIVVRKQQRQRTPRKASEKAIDSIIGVS